MNKRCFTLLSGKSVDVAPGTRVIPSEEFSTLKMAHEVLEHVQQEAVVYRADVAKEGEIAKEAGWQEGYQEGFLQWAQHLAQLENTLADLKQALEKKVLSLALQAAKKIVGQHLSLSEDAIVEIVTMSLKPVAQHKKITIYVNPQEWAAVDQAKPRLRPLFEHLESLSVRPRDGISPGGCMIETELGIINAKIEQRWSVLEQAFEKMAAAVPSTPPPVAAAEEGTLA